MINRLKELLICTDVQCQTKIVQALRDEEYHVIIGHEPDKIDADFIFAYPESKKIIPVLLMAHWDTMRVKSGKYADEPVILFEENGKLENADGILGADDRAGIQMILEAQAEYEEKPLLLFTNHEETGGKGMKTFLSSGLLEEWLDAIYLAVSVDRKGHNQWVCYYNNVDDTLTEFMQRLGYVEEFGTWTDGSDLATMYNLPHVNVSYGGYLPHTADEFVLKDSFTSGVSRLSLLLEKCDKKFIRSVGMTNRYSYRKNKTIYPSSNQGKGTAAYDKVPEDVTIMLPAPMCDICGKHEASWNTKAKLFICHKCVNRIMDKYKQMTPENAMHGIEDLEREKRRSREMNVLLKPLAHVNKEFPDCPVCGKKDHVSWSPKLRGFVCTECSFGHLHDKDKHPWNGWFWTKNQAPNGGVIRMYVKEDNVYEIDPTGTKVLRVVPVDKHEILARCDLCEKVKGSYVEYKNGMKVCPECASSIGDLVDDWEDSQRSVLKKGSEDSVPF